MRILTVLVPLVFGAFAHSQIPTPDDAPRPLAAMEAVNRFRVPPGFRIELVASEPLVREPSGICWDAQGRMFVCELHGYNLEGQLDIEELNQTGKLDRIVRRVQAEQRHKDAAEKETYGTIKLLRDTDGDGRMDRATVWADRLPPCLGICPARGGIIAACHTKILFLADRDGDDRAEVQEVLFEGFAEAPLERSVNQPRLGPDNWIYLGSSAGGGTIRGKYLSESVSIPNTDIRIRPDGSAIEPIPGRTHTMGFAFTESGDRFVISTRTPAIFVAPIAWRYLIRNPNVATGNLERTATDDTRAYPTSQPHPWRRRRADDPDFSKYYSDRYGVQESAPNGYFTSACSPLVYQDTALPGLGGHLFACEPAQNFVYRGIVQRDGTALRVRRTESEQASEFLTSSDPWFHAISLAHGPEGNIYLVDFYREIIEDYSAIPRYLQQQYGLAAGQNHGRIWRLTHDQAPAAISSADMSGLSPKQLTKELASDRFWRRQTARRLLIENRKNEARTQQQTDAISRDIAALVRDNAGVATTLNALSTLEGLGTLQPGVVMTALDHPTPAVRRRAVQLSEPWLGKSLLHPDLLNRILTLTTDESAIVRLQLALTLGEVPDDRSRGALAELARSSGHERWMDKAILCSVATRGGQLLSELLRSPHSLNEAQAMVGDLCFAIASRREGEEFSQAIQSVHGCGVPRIQVTCLKGFREGLGDTRNLSLTDAAREAMLALRNSIDESVRDEARSLAAIVRTESASERQARLTAAIRDLADVRLSTEHRIRAAEELADDHEPRTWDALLSALTSSTPRLREAILSQIFRHEKRLPKLLDAIESEQIPVAWLSALRRETLLAAGDSGVRERTARLIQSSLGETSETYDRYIAALNNPRDLTRGEQVFRNACGNCHQAHGIGHAVGPDLNAEFLRAEETVVRDVLFPTEKISSGFGTFAILTTSGQVISGVLDGESPTSITLRQDQGKTHTILRKDVDALRALPVSLMPEDLSKRLSPQELADALAWLRRPQNRLVLVDENAELLVSLSEGDGSIEFIDSDHHSGNACLRVTPLQRHNSRIPHWEFAIREKPSPGEYRYLRYAWKSIDASGVMLELADRGQWPPADQALRRYHAGRNTTSWGSVEVNPSAPREWTVVTRDLWKDFGDFTLTGIAPTAMGGAALFDSLELLRVVDRDTTKIE